MNNTLLGIIYLVAFSHGLMLTISLWRKSGPHHGGRWLAVITALMCYKLLETGVLNTGFYPYLAHLMDLLPAVVLFIGPMILLYVRHTCGYPSPQWWVVALHFVPAMVMWARNAPSVFRPLADKVAMWDSVLASPGAGPLPWIYVAMLLSIKIHLGAYLFFSWRTLGSLDKASLSLRADNSQQVVHHIRYAIAAFFLLESVWVSLFVAQQFAGIGTLASVSNIWLLFVAAMVMGLGFVGLQSPNLLFSAEERNLAQTLTPPPSVPTGSDNNVKYLHSALPDSTGEALAAEVEQQLRDQQLFLNDKLTLTELAKATGIKSHTLSQVINQTMNTNFYRLINGYRVQYATELIEDNKVNWPLERIALESGFSNRVTFSKAFKEVIGSTPSAYKKQLAQTG